MTVYLPKLQWFISIKPPNLLDYRKLKSMKSLLYYEVIRRKKERYIVKETFCGVIRGENENPLGKFVRRL